MMTQILESHLKEIEDVLASEMNNFNLKQEKKQTYKYLKSKSSLSLFFGALCLVRLKLCWSIQHEE